MRTAAQWGLLWAVSWMAGPTAMAQAPHADEAWLQWHAPPGCPDADWIRHRVLHVRADRPLDSHPWEVVAEVQKDAAGTWSLRLIVTAPTPSERTLEGPSCAEVSEGAALLLALLLEGTPSDGETARSTQQASGKTPPAPIAGLALDAADVPPGTPAGSIDAAQSVVFLPTPTQPEPESTSPASTDEEAPRHRAHRGARTPDVEVGFFVVGDVATLPKPSAGFATQLGLEFRRVWLGGGALYLFPRVARSSALPEARTRIDLWTLQSLVCGSLPVGARARGRQGPCFGVESGRMRAEEIGLFGGDFGSAPWLAFSLGVRGGMVLAPHWGLFGFMGVAVPVIRRGFFSGLGADEVLMHRSSPVVLRMSLGFAWRQR